MGGKVSKNVQPIPSFTSVKLMSAAEGTDCKRNEMAKLQQNIQGIIQNMKNDVASNRLVPETIFKPLFDALDFLQKVLDPSRPNVCYVIRNSGAGKSSLINRLANSNVCKVSDDETPETFEFHRVPVLSMNTILYDCIGFGSNNSGNLVKQYKAQMKGDGRPDAIILHKTLIRNVNILLKTLRNERYDNDVPVICVLNKIDEYCPNGLPPSEDQVKKLEQSVRNALDKVNKILIFKAISCVAVSAKENYAIDQLRCNINAQSPLNAQIIGQNLDYLQQYRFSIANKIIAAFSIATAAVSRLPIVDIAIVTFLQEWMYKMLACFSVNPTRTADTFKSINRIQQIASIGIRVGAFCIGGVLQLSVVGYVIGSSICVGVATTTTAALGWSCYHYFVN